VAFEPGSEAFFVGFFLAALTSELMEGPSVTSTNQGT